MVEIEPDRFSDEERDEIGALAKDLASEGREAIDELTSLKISLCMVSLRAIDSPVAVSDRLALAQSLNHEVRIIDEVIRQAKVIRQIQGVDELSQLDRDAQEAGMGSVFDENSLIGQKFRSFLK